MNQSLWSFTLVLLLLTAGCQSSAGAPYATRDVKFSSGDALLSGRLYVPNGEGPYPAVVLVHGSDAITRDSYREYSEYFASNGIVALNYDKRGCGESTGDFLLSNFDDLAKDALAGVEVLKSRPFVDRRRIGLWGIGQGGWVILAADRRSDDISFLINISGAAVTPGEQTKFALANELRQAGHSEETVETFLDLHVRLLAYFKTRQNRDELLSAIDRALRDAQCRQAHKESFLEDWIRMARDERMPQLDQIKLNPWVRDYDFDPAHYYRNLRTPTLVVYGGRDHLVNVDESRRALESAFAQTRNESSRVVVYPIADHMLKIRRRPDFLASPGFPEGYLELLTNWIKSSPAAM